jgi:hypothetical protein
MFEKHHVRKSKPQDVHKHPPGYERDLNPDHLGGQNIGQSVEYVMAGDRKELTRAVELYGFTKDELRHIPTVPSGSRLERGKTYLDLRAARKVPFTASSDMVVGPDTWLVPKAETPWPFWNRLLGLEDHVRTQ